MKYAACGLAGLAASTPFTSSAVLSLLLGVLGCVAVIGWIILPVPHR